MLIKKTVTDWIRENKKVFTIQKIAVILIGTAILSFGIRNIHQQADITEGGVLGMILLLNHWFGASPYVVTPILDILCYAFALRLLGKSFLKLSILSTVSLSFFFWMWELFPPVLPDLTGYPLAAAILGGVFVGTGVGLVVKQGGSTGGDDALALAVSKLSGCQLSRAYLATDLIVLLLSFSYIPIWGIGYSLVTVFISSALIGRIKVWKWKPSVKQYRRV